MNLDFFQRFADPYFRTEKGRGTFLAGLVLGIVAGQQVERGGLVADSPLFKQISFGRMQMRDIHRLLARVPELSKAYRLVNQGRVAQLLGTAGDLLLGGGNRELGVDGNFAFSMAFTNAWRYYKAIFPKDEIIVPQGVENDGEMAPEDEGSE